MTEFASTIGLDASQPADDGLSKPFAVLVTGKFKRADFGEINVTPGDLDSAVKNFEAITRGDGGQGIPIDVDHSFANGGGSKAVGWIKSLQRVGEKLMARVAWTSTAREQIEAGEYRKFSPEFTSAWKDEHGQSRGFALLAGALTNRPHIKALTVALDERAPTQGVTVSPQPHPLNVIAQHLERTDGVELRDAYRFAEARATEIARERAINYSEALTIVADEVTHAEPATADAAPIEIQDQGYGDGTHALPDDDLEAARRAADEHEISLIAATQLSKIDRELGELSAPPQAHQAPWLDARPLKEPPRPWSDEDWQRDQRRAIVAGVQVNRETWQSYAEQGQDVVSELAGVSKADRIAQLKQFRSTLLAVEQPKESQRRTEALLKVRQEAAEEKRLRELDILYGSGGAHRAKAVSPAEVAWVRAQRKSVSAKRGSK